MTRSKARDVRGELQLRDIPDRRAEDRDGVAVLGGQPHVVGDRVRVAGVAAVLHHEQDVHCAPLRPARSVASAASSSQAPGVGVVAGQVRRGSPAPRPSRAPGGAARRSGSAATSSPGTSVSAGRAVDRRDEIARQHQDRQRCRRGRSRTCGSSRGPGGGTAAGGRPARSGPGSSSRTTSSKRTPSRTSTPSSASSAGSVSMPTMPFLTAHSGRSLQSQPSEARLADLARASGA